MTRSKRGMLCFSTVLLGIPDGAASLVPTRNVAISTTIALRWWRSSTVESPDPTLGSTTVSGSSIRRLCADGIRIPARRHAARTVSEHGDEEGSEGDEDEGSC